MTKSLLQRINDNADIIEAYIKSLLDKEKRPYQEVIDSMMYSSCSGGKRIRPFLTVETARMLGASLDAALPYACAIEMIHTYSLIHDDLPCMDNDDVRRGKPTNHKVFGEANALLAGDALLTYAFYVAASNQYCTPEQNISAVKLLSENAGHHGMIGGQVLDLEGESRELDREEFLLMNNLKTGYLIKTACLLGCICAGFGEDSEEYKALEKFASCIGLAFQIEDDILDLGTEDNKTTFLSFLSVDEARNRVAELTKEAKEALSGLERDGILSEFAEYLANRNV